MGCNRDGRGSEYLHGDRRPEILQDLPDVETIVVPFGGGGVSCGIAATLRALKPDTRVIAAECEGSTPVTSALAAGKVVKVDHQASFISGIGAPSVLPEMWPLVSDMLDGSVVSSLEAVCDAIRMSVEITRIKIEESELPTDEETVPRHQPAPDGFGVQIAVEDSLKDQGVVGVDVVGQLVVP